MKKIITFLLMFNFYLIPAKADQLLEQGREIFLNQGNCASCHSLSDAKSDGGIGPNLNEILPTKERVLTAVTRGIGVMPAYDGILTSEEIDAVSHYVSTVSQQ
tara:strand:- start:197 stop:505 length:309 start_codon:yes stop_codon:yes gene_type:complete